MASKQKLFGFKKNFRPFYPFVDLFQILIDPLNSKCCLEVPFSGLNLYETTGKTQNIALTTRITICLQSRYSFPRVKPSSIFFANHSTNVIAHKRTYLRDGTTFFLTNTTLLREDLSRLQITHWDHIHLNTTIVSAKQNIQIVLGQSTRIGYLLLYSKLLELDDQYSTRT